MGFNIIYKERRIILNMREYILLLLSALILIAGCSNEVHNELNHENEHAHEETLGTINSENRILLDSESIITTTFYPLQEITQAIVADHAQVNVIVDFGVDPHSFEPTSKQLVELSNSELYIGMGGLFSHIEEEILEVNKDILSFDAAHNVITIIPTEHEHHEDEEEEHHEEEEHAHEEFDYDPHVWLSIGNMKIITNEILEQLVILAPEYESEFRTNARNYINKLSQLEQEYSLKLASCSQEVIIVNHKAFGYLAEEYNFEQISIAGFSPESEPTPQTLQNVINEAKEHGVSYVYSEGQLDPKVAQTIAQDIGGDVLELNPLKMSDDETYFSIMEKNLENLVLGLEC